MLSQVKRSLAIAGSIVVCGLLFQNVAYAFGASVAAGYGKPRQLILTRASLSWDFDKEWFQTDVGYLGGYFDASFTHFESEGNKQHHHQSVNAISVVPMFRYHFESKKPYTLFLEAGVGASGINPTRLAKRRFSTGYQFDDRIGVGVTFGQRHQYEVVFNMNHVSNAHIKDPNSGIDVNGLLTLRYWVN
jgi:lipid A 3-O-deacylase